MTATLDTTCFFVLYLCFTLLYFILCVVQWTRNEHARHHLVSLYFFVLYFTLLYVISCVAQWTRNEHAMNTQWTRSTPPGFFVFFCTCTWSSCVLLYLICILFVVLYLYFLHLYSSYLPRATPLVSWHFLLLLVFVRFVCLAQHLACLLYSKRTHSIARECVLLLYTFVLHST